MHSDLQRTIYNCQLAIETAENIEDWILSAGLAGLIQRHQTEEALFETILASCKEGEDAIIDQFSERLTGLSEEIELSHDEEEQHMLWYGLFLDMGALFFINEQPRYAKEIRQICTGIGENWKNISDFSERILASYPPKEGDLTRDFLEATMNAAKVDFEDNMEPFPALWLEKAMGLGEPMVLNVGKLAASSGEGADSSETIFFGKGWTLSLIEEDGFPDEFVLGGTQNCQAFFNDKEEDSELEGDGLFWKIRYGRWSFVIEGEKYSFVLNE